MQSIAEAMQHFAAATELYDADDAELDHTARAVQEREARTGFERCLASLALVLGDEPSHKLEELHTLAAGAGGGGSAEGGSDDEMMRELTLLRSEAHRKCASLLEKGVLGDTWPERQARMRSAHFHYLRALVAVPTNVEARSGLAALLRLHADGLGTQLAPERALQLYDEALRLILEQCESDPVPWPICDEDETLCETVRRKLALLLLQQPPASAGTALPEADGLLRQQDFKVRLSPELLCHRAMEQAGPAPAAADDGGDLLRVVDDALSAGVIARLRKLFSATAPFWSEHGYDTLHLHSRSYFSYLHPLEDCIAGAQASRANLMGQVIAAVYKLVCERWPHVQNARYAEWWAHCRPHSSGHQMHFDSEDEGQGELRHPIVSTVLYISDRGGPTLITSQLPGDQHVCTKAFVAFPKANRLVAFDGRRLHGVIPGHGAVHDVVREGSSHRISVMIAFWADVKRKAQVHEDGSAGASHPWPGPSSAANWHRAFDRSVDGSLQGDSPADVSPQPVSALWEPVLGDADGAGAGGSTSKSFVEALGWKKQVALPHYEQCFTGT